MSTLEWVSSHLDADGDPYPLQDYKLMLAPARQNGRFCCRNATYAMASMTPMMIDAHFAVERRN
jgi:hypothetical protein